MTNSPNAPRDRARPPLAREAEVASGTLAARGDAVLLRVRASPGASRTAITGVYRDCLKVSVVEPPEGGKANRALARCVAKELGLRRSQIKLHAGETSRIKTFLITGSSISALSAGIHECLCSRNE